MTWKPKYIKILFIRTVIAIILFHLVLYFGFDIFMIDRSILYYWAAIFMIMTVITGIYEGIIKKYFNEKKDDNKEN